jgi:hypothetical protein
MKIHGIADGCCAEILFVCCATRPFRHIHHIPDQVTRGHGSIQRHGSRWCGFSGKGAAGSKNTESKDEENGNGE